MAAGVPRWHGPDPGGGPADRACRDRAAARQAQAGDPAGDLKPQDLPAVDRAPADRRHHGGRARASRAAGRSSFEPTEPAQLAARCGCARSRRSCTGAVARHGLAVWTVRYRYRGWNGDQRSPGRGRRVGRSTRSGSRHGDVAGRAGRALDGRPDRARGRRRPVGARDLRARPMDGARRPGRSAGRGDRADRARQSRLRDLAAGVAEVRRAGSSPPAARRVTSWCPATCTRWCSAGGAGTGSPWASPSECSGWLRCRGGSTGYSSAARPRSGGSRPATIQATIPASTGRPTSRRTRSRTGTWPSGVRLLRYHASSAA